MEEKRELAALASAATYTSKNNPPMLLIQGEEDPDVPVEEMIAFHEALIAAGVDSALKMLPGTGHGWSPELTQEDITAFFTRTLTIR